MAGLGACAGDPPPCSAEDCAPWCAEHADLRAVDRSDEATSRVLSALEVRLLDDRLFGLRQGPVLAPERGFGVCRGATRCEAWLGDLVNEPLPPGPYVFHAEVMVPEDGAWTLVYERVCRSPDPGAPLDAGRVVEDRRTERFPLRHQTGGRPFVLEVLEGFRAPTPEQTTCQATIRAEGPVPTTTVFTASMLLDAE